MLTCVRETWTSRQPSYRFEYGRCFLYVDRSAAYSTSSYPTLCASNTVNLLLTVATSAAAGARTTYWLARPPSAAPLLAAQGGAGAAAGVVPADNKCDHYDCAVAAAAV